MKQYKDLCRHVLEHGEKKGDRTGPNNQHLRVSNEISFTGRLSDADHKKTPL